MTMTQVDKYREAQSLYQTGNADQRYVLERLWPELRESDDERMKKAISYVLNHADCSMITGTGFTIHQMNAWIEKHGEKTPVMSTLEGLVSAKTDQKKKWQPTDEQINELQRLVTSIPYFTGFKTVVSLLIELKDLKEK